MLLIAAGCAPLSHNKRPQSDNNRCLYTKQVLCKPGVAVQGHIQAFDLRGCTMATRVFPQTQLAENFWYNENTVQGLSKYISNDDIRT